MASGGGVSVLDAMAGKIMEKKVQATGKRPTLTALPGEAPGGTRLATIMTPATFPNDKPGPEVMEIVVGLERQREALTGVINALRLLMGDPALIADTKIDDAETTQKLLEKEADRRAQDRERAEAGDKRAVERIEKEEPMEVVTAAAVARDAKRAAVLDAMTEGGEEPEDFNERLARLQKEAQASVFNPVETSAGPAHAFDVVAAAAKGEGWKCPTHGDAVDKISPRRGAHYRACPVSGCIEFERL